MKRWSILNAQSLLFLLVSFLIISSNTWADDWPISSYITYESGTIPVVISIPHGGTKSLSWIYSICGEYNQDINTIDLGEAIVAAFEKRYPGARPYIIYNDLKRQYFDANRDPGRNNRETLLYAMDEIDPGYTGDLDTVIAPGDVYAYVCTGSTNVWTAQLAKDAWYVFNSSIDKAKKDIYDNLHPQILYIDLHSYVDNDVEEGEPQLIELGYGLLYNRYTANSINANKIETSLRYLNSGQSLEELIRGATSFGNILNDKADTYYNEHEYEPGVHNYTSVPSAEKPIPLANYNAGGFNTFYQTIVDYRCDRIPYSYDYVECDENSLITGHGSTSGLQIEVPRDYIKYDHDGEMGRKHLSRVLVDTIAAYLTTHYNYTLDGSSSSHFDREGSDTEWPE